MAVLLGNMSDYPQCIGEWVRLKASPSVKIVRSLLLDPAVGERLHRYVVGGRGGSPIVGWFLISTGQYHPWLSSVDRPSTIL